MFANVLKPRAKRLTRDSVEAGAGGASAAGIGMTPATEFKLGRKTMTDATGAKINLFAKKRTKNTAPAEQAAEDEPGDD